MLREFDRAHSNCGGFTIRLFVVVVPVGQPATVFVPVRRASDLVVLIVSWLVQVGVHPSGLNDAIAPLGKPEAERATFCVGPPISVAVIVVEPAAPCMTTMS